MERASEAKMITAPAPETVEAPYSRIVDQLPGVSILAFDTEVRFTAAAGAGLREMGWEPDELVGRRLAEVVTAEHLDRLLPQFELALRGGTAVFESRGTRRADLLNEITITPLHSVDGSIIGGLLVAKDVSESRRQAELLRSSEERSRRLADESSDMQAIYSPEGVYLEVSSASERLFGWRPDELIGQSSYEWFHPDDLAEIRAAHEFVLEVPATTTVTYRLRCKDDSYRWVEVIGRSTFDPIDGSVVFIQCTTRDISERRERDALAEQRRTDAAVMSVAGAIAHQLNSMLTAVIGGLELAHADAPDAAGLGLARAAAEQAADVGRRLLAISGRHGVAPHRFDVVDRIDMLEPTLLRAAGAGAGLRVAAPPSPLHVVMDDAEFGLLMIELIRTLGARSTQEHAIQVVVEALDEARLRITASSDRAAGPTDLGQAATDASLIGELGLGLGIAAVQSIVRTHGGVVSFEHTIGGGATVAVVLPLAGSDDA